MTSLTSAIAREFVDPIAALVPGHAHVVDDRRRWTATWSTPGGLWTVDYHEPSSLAGDPNVKVTGGDRFALCVTYPRRPDAVIAILAAYGAFDGPESADAQG